MCLRLQVHVGPSWTIACHVLTHLGEIAVRLFGAHATLAPFLEQKIVLDWAMAATDDARFSSLVVGIVESTPFQMRRTE